MVNLKYKAMEVKDITAKYFFEKNGFKPFIAGQYVLPMENKEDASFGSFEIKKGRY